MQKGRVKSRVSVGLRVTGAPARSAGVGTGTGRVFSQQKYDTPTRLTQAGAVIR